MKIAIDLGHGVGSDRGAVGFINEETIINEVGILVINKLKSLGNTIVEVRPTSASRVSDSLFQRTDKADANNVDLYVSIHANAGGGQGTEVFTYGAKEVPEARAVLNKLVSLGFINRGIKDGSNLYVIRNTKAIAMLIEVCFVDTQSDVNKYKSVGAEAIANGIVNGLTGQISPTSKGYVVTNYLPNGKNGDNSFKGVDADYVLQYFKGVKCYFKGNEKGVWIETQYLDMNKCNELKAALGSWFYSIEK